VTAVLYTAAAHRDLQRLGDFLRESDPAAAERTATMIAEAITVLVRHPLIGRSVGVNRRELVIFRGRTGYLARYSYSLVRDEVVILSIRHQREVDA
jgi:plasmid stabilization system protein ParE